MFGSTGAAAKPPASVNVWFRGSQGCPAAEAFIERVQQRVPRAHLAKVGDHIDFVVTLGKGAKESRGEVERQTDAGTVAIRKLHAKHCDDLADALALTLALAIAPETRRRSQATRTVDPALGAPHPVGRSPSRPHASGVHHAKAALPRAAPSPAAIADTGARAGTERKRPEPTRPWMIGAGGWAALEVAPDPMPGALLFVERELGGRGALRGSALRATALAARSLGTRDGSGTRVEIATGRLEACSLQLGSGTLNLRTCLATDVGVVRARGLDMRGTEDTGLWTTVGAHQRLRWVVSPVWALEAQLGVLVPLTRYALISQLHRTLGRTRPVSLAAAVGVGYRLP